MKYLSIAFILFSIHVVAAENATLDGVLFEQDKKWFLYVQSDKATFKKGTVELKNISSAQKNFLIDRMYVQIKGEMDTCPFKKICIIVKSIKPSLLDPLAGRKK